MQRIPILMYHQTAPLPVRSRRVPHPELFVPPRTFERQMRSLVQAGLMGLSIRDLGPYLRGERSGKVVGLTLDDGYEGNFEHALPILCELGFSATAFIVSGQIGGENAWDRRAGVPGERLMGATHLRRWLDAGMDIGAHTCSHVDLLRCDSEQARDEIAGSKRSLERLFDAEVRSFCYPYGHYADTHVEMVRQAGYEFGLTANVQQVRPGADMLRLPRIPVRSLAPLRMLLALT